MKLAQTGETDPILFINISFFSPPLSLFMAVPTIYVKLLQTFNELFDKSEKEMVRKILKRDVRLMVSGSAALPEVQLKSIILITKE